jgi:hypothetical protein
MPLRFYALTSRRRGASPNLEFFSIHDQPKHKSPKSKSNHQIVITIKIFKKSKIPKTKNPSRDFTICEIEENISETIETPVEKAEMEETISRSTDDLNHVKYQDEKSLKSQKVSK